MSKICLFFNTPSLYRELIYKMIDDRYDADWFFSDLNNDLETFDITQLKRVAIFHVMQNNAHLYYTKGVVNLLFKRKYSTYILMGGTRDLGIFFFAILKRFFRKKKLIFWTHGWYGKETFIERTYKDLLYKSADCILCYGNYSKELMVARGYHPNKLLVIHNSLNYNVQLGIRKSLCPSPLFSEHFGNNNPIVIFVGRLRKNKKLNMLLESALILKQQGQIINVVFIGDGPERNLLEEKARGLGIEKQTWFYGACYDETINAQLLYNADVCVSPGNVGLTAMHALMFGCPVITHNSFPNQMPEFESIVPGKTGDFYEYGDINSLSTTISKWINNKIGNRDYIRKSCYDEIDSFWSPYYQIEVLEKAIKQA